MTLPATDPGVRADEFVAARAYDHSCSMCHGIHGNANTPIASGMTPPPTDFSNPQTAARLTLEAMIQTISKGKKGTAMPGWSGRYSRNEIKALALHIVNTFMNRKGENRAE
ncbi:MAG: cytochrome c [Magnetococcales bacterium]|nr:cytochrome c [Magnetococcales bacterium]